MLLRFQTIKVSDKTMIHSKTPKVNSKQAAPNIVARLMGMDTMTSDTKSVGCSTEKYIKNNDKKKQRSKTGSVVRESSVYSRPLDLDCTYNCKNRDDDDEWNNCQNSGKGKEREHPQHEKLQEFKKDFQAWQAARFEGCSVLIDDGSISKPLLARESLNNSKMKFCSDPLGVQNEKSIEPWSHTGLHERGTSENHVNSMVFFPEKQKDFFRSRSSTLVQEFEQSLLMICDEKLNGSSSPNKIVILKAGTDRISHHGDLKINSSGTFQERRNMEDFLEAVSERLKCELLGKTSRNGSMIRGSGIETPYCEKATYPKQIAYNIEKHFQGGVTRDLRMGLLCSAPTRSYRSTIQFDKQRSTEAIDRDTRRFLSERLRNVLKNDTKLNEEDGISRSNYRSNPMTRLKQPRDTSKVAKGMRHREIDDIQEMQTRCFRQPNKNILVHHGLPPWGKLEVIGTAAFHDVKKPKEKNRFNLKEKVSNLKYSHIFRNRLFGRKLQAIDESHNYGYDPTAMDFTKASTVLMSMDETHDNFTEVPPSPASFCSSYQEEQWRTAECLHPASPPGLPSRNDTDFVKEISFYINELMPQLNQLSSEGIEEKLNKQETNDYELEKLEDEAEAYIRDILIASGLYAESWDTAFMRGETFFKPIGNSVFEQVEESVRAKENNTSRNDHDMNRRVLFDVLNEALSEVLIQPRKMSRFIRKPISNSTESIPCGKELLGMVWEMVSTNLYPPSEKCYFSIDNIAARHLGSYPWFASTNEETDCLVREIEYSIVKDMVEELVNDIHQDLSWKC